MPVRAVLLDFDFTLADPSPWLIPAWQGALREIGAQPVEHQRLMAVVGRPLRRQYATLVGEAAWGPRFDVFEQAHRRYRDDHAAAETAILPGVPEALGILDRAGVALGIVSTGAPDRVRAILARAELARYFRIVQGGAAVKAPAITETAGALAIDPADTVYVGDHPDDCRAALTARVAFVGVRSGAHGAEDFPQGTVFIPSAADLPSHFGLSPAWPQLVRSPA